MALKNHHDSIPNGFQFSQPEINWDSGPVWGWNQLRSMIISKRQANPRFGLSTDPNKVDWEMEQQNVARLQSMPGTSHFLTSDAPPETSPPVFRRPQHQGQGAAADKLEAGVDTLLEWLGSGASPVEKELAESRATICSTCPNNRAGGMTSFFTLPASEAIRKMLSIKNDMSLSTSKDSVLNVCSVCLCPMKLKVWTPIDHVAHHTSEAVKSELPSFCWIVKELTS